MNPTDAGTLKALSDAVMHTAGEAERKWGVARLPLLIPITKAEAFERLAAEWYDELQAAYEVGEDAPLAEAVLDALRGTADRLQRAWRTLDRLATESGAQPLSPDVWEAVGRDGQVISVVRTTAEACALVREGRALHVYTLEEVANVIAALPAAISDAKVWFPGATIAKVNGQGRSRVSHDDAIPFG